MTKVTIPQTGQPSAPPLPQGDPRNLGAEAFTAVADAAECGALLDAGRFADLLLMAGRLDGPALLFDAWFGKTIDAGTLAAHVGRVWNMAEYPDAALDRPAWRQLFAMAGFTADGRPAERPADPVELWRGSVPERRDDWSWSTRRAVAEGYATGTGARRPTTGRLYHVVAPPSALLAHNTGRDEDEYVLDTDGLSITEVPLTH
ncbi:hypothetical protein [Streptomyces noursei]|uniref:hypothetical protein n=1 Tax=Streptomyces noursei TaxID=1971 RepID=UPI001675753C|nr:hypothetical protein [Streptomyces noursei]MCZ1013910.1 hypothetical protein [Streptomyces noursei]GGX40935.1 hypothetical protein GCM10010341_73650 [Streptomyces noursei]